MKKILNLLFKFVQVLGLEVETGDIVRFVNKAVDAFFDQDLLTATKTFLGNSKGSFGLWQGFLKRPLHGWWRCLEQISEKISM